MEAGVGLAQQGGRRMLQPLAIGPEAMAGQLMLEETPDRTHLL